MFIPTYPFFCISEHLKMCSESKKTVVHTYLQNDRMISKHNQLLHHLWPPLEPPAAEVLCSSLELNWGSTTWACRGGRGVSLAAPGRLPTMS